MNTSPSKLAKTFPSILDWQEEFYNAVSGLFQFVNTYYLDKIKLKNNDLGKGLTFRKQEERTNQIIATTKAKCLRDSYNSLQNKMSAVIRNEQQRKHMIDALQEKVQELSATQKQLEQEVQLKDFGILTPYVKEDWRNSKEFDTMSFSSASFAISSEVSLDEHDYSILNTRNVSIIAPVEKKSKHVRSTSMFN